MRRVHLASSFEAYVIRSIDTRSELELVVFVGIDGSSGDDGRTDASVAQREMANVHSLQVRLLRSMIDDDDEFDVSSRFFQRMGIFTFYFGICLFALLLRGSYRVPSSCLIQEVLDKEENTVKSIIADRMECKCHYTNFLWQPPFFDYYSNRTTTNSSESAGDDDDERSYLEPLVGPLSSSVRACERLDRCLLEVLNILDGLSILGALMYILLTVREFSYQNFKLDSFKAVNDPSRILFIFSCFITIAMLPARLTCSINTDDILCVYATLARAPYFFFFCR